jgi:hypothetical protein
MVMPTIRVDAATAPTFLIESFTFIVLVHLLVPKRGLGRGFGVVCEEQYGPGGGARVSRSYTNAGGRSRGCGLCLPYVITGEVGRLPGPVLTNLSPNLAIRGVAVWP